MTHCKKLVCAMVALILISGNAVSALAEVFTGTWNYHCYEDETIQDGVTPIEGDMTITATRPDPQHVEFSYDGHSVTFLQNDDILRLESPSLDTGDELWPEAYVMADGTHSAFFNIRQSHTDLNHIGFRVCLATRSTATLTTADLAGEWMIDMIVHQNLRNVADIPPSTSIRQSFEVTISDLGSNQIQFDVDTGTSLVFELSGNRLSLISDNGTADFHAFDMVTDGNTLAFGFSASETFDANDVSANIALGMRVPEPTTLALIGLGGLFMARRHRVRPVHICPRT